MNECVNDGIRKPMTDEQALQTLKSLKVTIARGGGITMFQGLVLEAMMHAIVALEEKVNENKKHI